MLLGPHLATGGADGGIKCWRAAEWLPPARAALPGPDIASKAEEEGSGSCCLVERYCLDPAILLDPGAVTLGRIAFGSSRSSRARSEPEARAPASGGGGGSGRKPADWVRHLALAGRGTAYVATTQGWLHRVDLAGEMAPPAGCTPASLSMFQSSCQSEVSH